MCYCKAQDRGKVLSELMFIVYMMPTVSQGGADKHKAKAPHGAQELTAQLTAGIGRVI